MKVIGTSAQLTFSDLFDIFISHVVPNYAQFDSIDPSPLSVEKNGLSLSQFQRYLGPKVGQICH